MTVTVAYVLEFPTLSGGERSLLALLGGLDRTRFRPIVVAPPGGPLGRALAAAGLPRVDRIEDAGAVAILHANSLAVGCRLGPIARDRGIPSVSHVRDIMRIGGERLAGLAAHRKVIAVSHATAAPLVAAGIPAERVTVIPNGISVERPDRRTAGAALRRTLGLASDTPIAGNVGQICLRKGQDVFIAAAARMARTAPELHFVVVGERFSKKDESIAFERALHETTTRPPLAGRVHFLGWRDDAIEIISGLDVLVHTAHQEPLGRVLLEALAVGTPVVATNVGGTREIITDGANGRLVSDGDEAALAQAAIELTVRKSHAELAAYFRNTGYETVRNSFTVERMCRDVSSLYESVLGSS